MTVISAMKFNSEEGAIVADEEATAGQRKDRFANKVPVVFSNDDHILIAGGTGALYVLDAAVERAIKDISGRDDIKNSLQPMTYLAQVLVREGQEIIDGHCVAKLRCTQEDVLRGYKIIKNEKGEPIGKDEIGELAKQKYQEIIKHLSENDLNSGFLTLGYDKGEGMSMHWLSCATVKPMSIARPYQPAGSGADMADQVLGDFVNSLRREKRNSIDRVAGIEALLYATQKASERNVGVGGAPYIRVIEKGKIITPDEDCSRLASEVVKGNKTEGLKEGFCHEALDSLIYGPGDFEAVEKEMWKAALSQVDLSRTLRGYK